MTTYLRLIVNRTLSKIFEVLILTNASSRDLANNKNTNNMFL